MKTVSVTSGNSDLVRFHYGADDSVEISTGDHQLKVNHLLEFVAHIVRSRRVAAIEQMSTDELLS